MRRRHLAYMLVAAIVVWNVLTFLTIGKTTQETKLSVDVPNLVQRVEKLQKEIRDQVHLHEKLLATLEKERKELEQSIIQGKDNHRMLIHTTNIKDRPAQEVPRKIELDENVVKKEEEKAPGIVEDTKPKAAVTQDLNSIVLPVLVFACNREEAIKRSLNQLLKLRPSEKRFPIIVSQDCGHAKTASAIQSYGDKVTHIQHPDHSEIQGLPWSQRKFAGYYKIARHYKWALNQIFHTFNHSAVIIVEDDLDISPDFFEYFSALFPILHNDPSLWCISAWNDNGKAELISNNPELLYRTDFFPGLGWMMERKLWLELEKIWPATFWDDWMRHPHRRKDRACIHPELSRTKTFGKIGISKGQFFEKHLKFIKLNEEFVPWTKKDLSYLMKEEYDVSYVRDVYNCPAVGVDQLRNGAISGTEAVRVQYDSKESFKSIAKKIGIMDDLKSGVPRGGYRGITSFVYKGRRVHLAPPLPWKGYDPKWN